MKIEALIEKYNKRKYIFILGSGRNGTTFLSKELAKTKFITTTPEDKYFFWSMAHRKKYNLDLKKDFISFFNLSFMFIFDFRKQDFFKSKEEILYMKKNYIEMIEKNFNFIQAKNINEKYKLILDMILDVFTKDSDKECFVLHTPATLLVFDTAKEILTPYKVIFMQRDIHSFYVSAMKGNNRWFKSELDCIAYWNIVSDNIKKYYFEYEKSSIILKQENMINNPNDVKIQLENFLKIDLSGINLEYRGENTYFDSFFDRKKLLTEYETVLIEFFSYCNIKYFDYEFLLQDYVKPNIFTILNYKIRKKKLLINYFLRRKGCLYYLYFMNPEKIAYLK